MRCKAIIVFVVALALFALVRFCHHATAGFRLSKIENSTFKRQPENPLFSFPKEMEPILAQKFYYLARGLESFVFLSEDGQHVLKLFNNRKKRRLWWFSKIPLLQNRADTAREKIERTKRSYLLAYSTLKEELALEYLHLFVEDPCDKRVTIVDKIGICHSVDLNSVGFLIQRKAEIAYDYLEHLKQENKIEEAKEAIHSLIHLVQIRCSKGIGDHDPLIRTNCGFFEKRAILLDAGPFFPDPILKEEKSAKQEMHRIGSHLKQWLGDHFPEIYEEVDRAVLQ